MCTPAPTTSYDDLPVHERRTLIDRAGQVDAYEHVITSAVPHNFSDLGKFISHRKFPYMATVGYRDRQGLEKYVTGPVRGAIVVNNRALLWFCDGHAITMNGIFTVATDAPVDPELAGLKAPRG